MFGPPVPHAGVGAVSEGDEAVVFPAAVEPVRQVQLGDLLARSSALLRVGTDTNF